MTLRSMMLGTALAALPFAAASMGGEPAGQTPASTKIDKPACAVTPMSPGQPWVLDYSWGGGMGPGSVELSLSSDGRAVITATPQGGKPTVKRVTIPADSLAKIAEVIDQSPLACIHTLPRKGYVVFDLGRYSLKFISGASTASAYVDECHTVDDGKAFAATINAIQQLAPLVGEDIHWGPFATTSAPGKGCEGR